MADFFKNRGVPSDFDAGPPANRKWAELFARTPNYRGLGKAHLGSEQFRWHFGPMFYRGRLVDGEVKVLVIGQEGAQDESLAHRSFAGGTGGRMQHFLSHLGISRSYLFLNTFVYPIFGQYDNELEWLAQHHDSPIVKHRHTVLDYVVERSDLRLVVAVGRAAKDTVITWVRSHGGSVGQGPGDVSTAGTSSIAPKLRAVGVVHPGAAGQGGSTSAIVADFKRALRKIQDWAESDPSWLPVDVGATRGAAADFKYKSAPIPFRDLPYGVCWRVGRGGTSSNRRDSQTAIQIFSAGGKYNQSAGLSYSASAVVGSKEGYAQDAGDVAYEPPKAHFEHYDAGPPASLAKLLMGREAGFAWPDFTALGVTAHPSLGHGPIYRGRFSNVVVLVLADQESHDDLFTARACTGDGGQHFQAWLEAAGIRKSYLILRTLPVDTLDLSGSAASAIANHAAVRALYREAVTRVLASNPVAVTITLGPVAASQASHVLPASPPRVTLPAHGSSGWLHTWQQALQTMQQVAYPRDLTNPSFAFDGTRLQIPRTDLPYGTLRWQGSSGSRAQRAVRGGEPSPDYYKISMPKWAADLDPESLSAEEQQAIDNAPHS